MHGLSTCLENLLLSLAAGPLTHNLAPTTSWVYNKDLHRYPLQRMCCHAAMTKGYSSEIAHAQSYQNEKAVAEMQGPRDAKNRIY